MPLLGLIWLAFALTLYWFAGLSPNVNNLISPDTKDPLAYLNGSGVTFVGVTIVAGIVIFAIQGLRNRRAGIQTDLIYRALPPD